ncbi:winged helix-turn-helix transcriptional regulator [Methanococcus voltae]|uniref:HTH hxlR-type domain-containing protein n=1 Tax=Methanococcus voltae (strain ATCC BAA-1334 / A3) TaxID=456320 RepID=D7DSR1_METV3|nr:winged helix-turn-helix transcriptional regulator [Methanococcus voltae]MCS3901772.1 DNA-binding HxlR family transcriptional regulator [Methanococcus voltae]
MIVDLIKKRHVDRILKTLNNNELYFGQLKNELNVDAGSLNKLLREMCDEGVVKKRIEEKTKSNKLSKVYYSLTDLGTELLEKYLAIENLDLKNLNSNLEDNKNIVDNSKNTIINNSGIVSGSHSTNINIKK